MHTQKVKLIKGEAPVKLVALFIGRIERKELEDKDPFGLKTLDFLIRALEVIDTKPQTWGAVAKYVLKKANNRIGGFYYTETLIAIAPHVSITVLTKIVDHFVSTGGIRAVKHITKTLLNRAPSFAEVLAMAEYHRSTWTSSDCWIWESLLELANQNDVATILGMIEEVKKHEDEPDFY